MSSWPLLVLRLIVIAQNLWVSKFVESVALCRRSCGFVNNRNIPARFLPRFVEDGALNVHNSSYTLTGDGDVNGARVKESEELCPSNVVFENLRDSFAQFEAQDWPVEFKTVRRLEYNRDSILRTYELAREADLNVCNNDYSEFESDYFVRFQGDDEEERCLTSRLHLPEGREIMRVPLNFCHSLDSCVDNLAASFRELASSGTDYSSKCVSHMTNLISASIGNLTSKAITSMVERFATLDRQGALSKSFEDRLSEFLAHKRMLVLRALILSDSVLSGDHKLIEPLNNPYIRLNSINAHERELILLTFALASEYYLSVAAALLRYLHDGRGFESTPAERVKTLWLHQAFSQKVSHIPLMLQKDSLEQVQEEVLKFKVAQRKVALQEVHDIFKDPLEVVRGRLEYIAQARSMLEDRSNELFYSTSEDLKTRVEDKLEEMEVELTNSEIAHQIFSKDVFSVNLGELKYVLKGELDSGPADFNFDGPFEGRSSTPDVALSFFNDYLIGRESSKGVLNRSVEDIVSSLNSIVNFNSIASFFCTIVSHAVRLQRDSSAAKLESSYIADAAPGIQCKVHSDGPSALSKGAFLVPLVDAINHGGADANAELSVAESNGDLFFTVTTTREVAQGAEILVDYGRFSNNVALLDYGFVSEHDGNNHLLMNVDASMIRDAARTHGLEAFVPKLFPEGLPKEKKELVEPLNLVEIDDKGDLSVIYKDPYFNGMPVVKYMEFTQRFMCNRAGVGPADPYYGANSDQDRTLFVDKPLDLDLDQASNSESSVNSLIRVDANGVPDPRLIYFIKVLLCKTRKKLDWLKAQRVDSVSRSINSPLDYKAFEVASSIPLTHVGEKYNTSLFEDFKQGCSGRLCKLQCEHAGTRFENLPQGGGSVPNAMILAHAMRQKIPFYRWSSFYSTLSKNPRPVVPEQDVELPGQDLKSEGCRVPDCQ